MRATTASYTQHTYQISRPKKAHMSLAILSRSIELARSHVDSNKDTRSSCVIVVNCVTQAAVCTQVRSNKERHTATGEQTTSTKEGCAT